LHISEQYFKDSSIFFNFLESFFFSVEKTAVHLVCIQALKSCRVEVDLPTFNAYFVSLKLIVCLQKQKQHDREKERERIC
jgi:hypothetical protein